MACRPESETILSREQLAEFIRRLQMLSDDGVERIYERPEETSARRCAQTMGGVLAGVAEA